MGVLWTGRHSLRRRWPFDPVLTPHLYWRTFEMGVRILAGVRVNDGDPPPSGACLYDSVTGRVLGVLFADAEEAEAFLVHLGAEGLDARRLDDYDLEARIALWLEQRSGADESGEPMCGRAVP